MRAAASPDVPVARCCPSFHKVNAHLPRQVCKSLWGSARIRSHGHERPISREGQQTNQDQYHPEHQRDSQYDPVRIDALPIIHLWTAGRRFAGHPNWTTPDDRSNYPHKLLLSLRTRHERPISHGCLEPHAWRLPTISARDHVAPLSRADLPPHFAVRLRDQPLS